MTITSLLGRLYRLNNDLQKAENEFKTAVKLEPDSEEAVTTLAYLYNEEGDTARAGEVLSSIPDAARSAKLYSALGYTYEQQKQYKNSIAAYRKAIELDHDNLDAIRGLAQNLMNDGQTDAALEQYKVIADANPEDAQTYLRMAEIYRKSGKFDLALDSLKKAGSMVQDSIEVPYNMAAVYQAQGRYDEAIQVLQDLLKKTEKPDNSYTQPEKNNRSVFLERLGTIYRDNKNDTQAIETFKKMLALGDENAERGYQQIIDTYRENKQWQQATDTAKEAVQKLPNNRSLKMVYAAQLSDMGQPDAGLEQVKSLLKGTAEDRDVYITLVPDVQPAEALAGCRGSSRQGRTAFHQGRRQAIRLLPARLDLRTPEEIRPGGRHVPQSPGLPIRRMRPRSTISATCWPTAESSWTKRWA